jgi:kynureninase
VNPVPSFSSFFEEAWELDQNDPLGKYRGEFYLPDGKIYLDGNSLGLLSKRSELALTEVLDSWKKLGIDGWVQGKRPWFYFAEDLGQKMAPLVGARPEEVVVTGSTTVNIHQLVATFYRPQGSRRKILADVLNFPSDLYALKSQLILHGYSAEEDLICVPSDPSGRYLDEDEIIAMMNEEVALAWLPAVLYKSGQLLDMEKLTKAAHERGILIGWDACHSVGAVPHRFAEWGVDFAAWCTYKYLNSGPGGVAGLYVHKKHHGTKPGLAGWFGSDKERQFEMAPEMIPGSDAGAYQIGTPHLLSMAPLIGSLSIFAEAGMEAIRKKSLMLTDFLFKMVDQIFSSYGFETGTPRNPKQRGGHLALEHPDALQISRALKAEGVIPDFRPPNVIRLAPVALYNSFIDVCEAMKRLKQIMDEKKYQHYPTESKEVT